MAHYRMLADYRFPGQDDDIRGARLYGRNEDVLGKVKDVVFDHQSGEVRYLVVQTDSRKLLVPADHIFRAAADENDFFVDMERRQLESLPDFDEKMLEDERRWLEHEQQHHEALSDWRKQQEQLYQQRWHDGVVQHKHGSSHNITPSPDELTRPADEGLTPPMGSLGEDIQPYSDQPEAEPSEQTVTGADLTPHRLAGKFPDAKASGSKLQMTPVPAHQKSEQQAYVASSRVPAESWEQNEQTSSSGPTSPAGEHVRKDYNWERSRRWARFEDLLRRNRVDIQAKCPACAPKKAA
jgi:sporulation protein YlmC with PRC-barrel domain